MSATAPRKRRRPWRWLAWILAVLALGLGTWSLVVGPRFLTVSRVTLTLPHWPKAHAGLRVALLSDLHVGSPHWGPERIRELVERTNAERPDLVVLAGDYVIDGVLLGTKTEQEPIAELLGELRAPLGVVAVLGNHDWWNGGERMRRALEARGVIVLENETRTLSRGGVDLFVVGLADALARRPDPERTLDAIPTGAPALVIVHEPDVFPLIDARASLTLAGHTHGGQVRLPFFGRPVVPSKFGQRYAAGHIVEDDKHLFVTTGVGTSILPIRFGVRPELVILTLE